MKPNLIKSILCAVALFMAARASADTPQSLLRGRELFGFNRWADARTELLRARAELPEDAAERMEVDFLMAACAVELGDIEAEAALIAFEKCYPGSIYGNDVAFSLASYYCASGDVARARACFDKVERDALAPSRREQYDIRLGYLEFGDGNYAEAYRHFSQIGPESTYGSHALYYRSYIDYADGKLDRAKDGFRKLAESNDYSDVAPYFLLQIAFREGDYRYVVENGEQLAAETTPVRRAEIERVVAESWFHLEDYNRTIEHIDRYVEAGGEMDRDANYLKGFSLYRTVRFAEAAECLRMACGAADALTQNASYHLADCALREGDKQAAMEAFAMAADETFDATIAEDALFNYAKLQYELGGGVFNGAINLLTRYMTRYPQSERADEVQELLIAAYYNSRDYDAAYRAIKSLPQPDGQTRAALQKISYFRGLEAFKQGDREAAKRYLMESSELNISPKYTSLTTFWLGEIAFVEGDYTVASARYNNYLKRAPETEREYAFAHYNLGYCAFMREKMSQAAGHFEKFTDLYTASDIYRTDALNRLGDVRFATRAFQQAVDEYDRAIAMGNGESHYARYKRAVTLGVMGRTKEMREALKQVLATGSGSYLDAAQYELGHSYMAESKYADAARELDIFVNKYPSSPRRAQALSDLGLAYRNLGDRQKSLKYYDRVVSSAPRSEEARGAMQGIREIYISEGEVDAYFDYAEKSGMESDLTALSRDSLSFAAARSLYLNSSDEVAARSLRSYVKSYPKGYYRIEALHYLGECYRQMNQRDEAIATLSELASEGQHEYIVPTLTNLAAMTREAGRNSEAAAAYRSLYDVEQGAAERAAAMLGYVRATVATGDGAAIEKMAADVAAKSDAGSVAQREAKYAWAHEPLGQGRRDEALVLFRELAAEVRSKEGAEAAYRIIESLYRSGEMKKTEQAVFDYAEREPHSYWLAKAFLILGDVYLKGGDKYQARATYQSVADGYSPADDGIVDEAKARISKLN